MSYPYPVSIIPNPNDALSLSQGQIQTNFANIVGWAGVDHLAYGDTNAGTHEQVTIPTVRGSDPTLSGTVTGMYYTKSISGTATPFFAGWNGSTTIVTQLGGSGSSPVLVPGTRGYVLFPGGFLQQWGQVPSFNGGNMAIGFATGPGINFPNNCFNVQVTVVAGNTTISLAISNITTAGFNLRALAFSGGPVSVNWLAVGN